MVTLWRLLISTQTGKNDVTADTSLVSYFEHALCVARTDDVLVGAPLYMEREMESKPREVGRVYVFLQMGPLAFTKPVALTGMHTFGRFGTAIAPLGDINQDGYNGTNKKKEKQRIWKLSQKEIMLKNTQDENKLKLEICVCVCLLVATWIVFSGKTDEILIFSRVSCVFGDCFVSG